MFDVPGYLSKGGSGRKIVRLKAKDRFFTQGDSADCIFYLHSGRCKLTVVAKNGKEATITLLTPGHFFGEDALPFLMHKRIATATAMVSCVAMKLDRLEMARVIHEEHLFSDFFVKFLLVKGLRTQADLLDQLFNSSERRLARTLLLMAEFGQTEKEETLIPRITQEALAEMVGTTRSRVSFFMNRFRSLGFITYKNRIKVKRSLLTVVLNDQLPEQNATHPKTSSRKVAN